MPLIFEICCIFHLLNQFGYFRSVAFYMGGGNGVAPQGVGKLSDGIRRRDLRVAARNGDADDGFRIADALRLLFESGGFVVGNGIYAVRIFESVSSDDFLTLSGSGRNDHGDQEDRDGEGRDEIHGRKVKDFAGNYRVVGGEYKVCRVKYQAGAAGECSNNCVILVKPFTVMMVKFTPDSCPSKDSTIPPCFGIDDR